MFLRLFDLVPTHMCDFQFIFWNEKPFLGICLGLQLLFDHSQENGGTEGLSILAGDVVNTILKNKMHNIALIHLGLFLKMIQLNWEKWKNPIYY
jgi:imidazoleglycerol phosphate synthase glutamine amidotransferase subunit HisH